jgi:hypothetical protein
LSSLSSEAHVNFQDVQSPKNHGLYARQERTGERRRNTDYMRKSAIVVFFCFCVDGILKKYFQWIRQGNLFDLDIIF